MVSADECNIVRGYRCSTLGSCQSGGVKRNILADHICRICDCFPGIPRRCTFCNEYGNNDGCIRDKINRQRSGNIRNRISAFFDTKYKYKFTIFTDCIERKYGKDWLL